MILQGSPTSVPSFIISLQSEIFFDSAAGLQYPDYNWCNTRVVVNALFWKSLESPWILFAHYCGWPEYRFSRVFRWNCSSGSDSAYSGTFLRSVVCLSVVCHTRAPCFNRSTDLDAIWQVDLWGPMTHCVVWRALTPIVRGNSESTRSCFRLTKNMIHQVAARVVGLATPQITSLSLKCVSDERKFELLGMS